MHFRSAWIAAGLLVVVACDGETPAADATAGEDAAVAEDGGREGCASAADCDDGLFCNGEEQCDPDDPGAAASGCVAGTAPCTADETCDDATDVCATCDTDADEDGHLALTCGGDDCDDADADRFPGNAEVCDTPGHDEDCADETYGSRDADADGFDDATCCNGETCGDDCDDGRAGVHPTEAETCDELDNDCDSAIDEEVQETFYRDMDEDGYGDDADTTLACSVPEGYAVQAGDCDDDESSANPATTELCDDEIDNDCDDMVDERGPRLFFRDLDGDSFGDAGTTFMSTACDPPTGYVTSGNDCDDTNPNVYPGAADRCDRIDSNCSNGGGIDALEDFDGDGHAPVGQVCEGGFPKDDCNDTSSVTYGGAPEACDSVDYNCSAGGGADPSEDFDGDRHAPAGAGCSGGYPRDDCDDMNGLVYPGHPELCDGRDNDCSAGGGLAPAEDMDGDMRAALTAPCANGPFNRDDCDDTRVSVYPGAPELCDGLDTNCSSGGGAAPGEDMDGDLHSSTGTTACTGGFPTDDCDDTNATIYLGATELCDRRDNACASGGGAVASEDMDMDMHSPLGASCAGGYPRDDCRDGVATTYLGATELCNRVDDNCSSGGGVEASEDMDMDMFAPVGATCSGGYPTLDCDDADAARFPAAVTTAGSLASPLNGARTGSVHAAARGTLRPTFRWRSIAGCVTYELQADDSCASGALAACAFPSPEVSVTSLTTTSHRPATNLAVSMSAPVGRRYAWRVRGCSPGFGCGPWSMVRYVDVGRVAGDFDGDGYSDLVLGEPTNGSFGRVRVMEGAAFGSMSTTASWTYANASHTSIGQTVRAGDVNGDGFGDLAVRATAGVLVFLGSLSGLAAAPAGSVVAGTLQTFGDVDADGYADLIVVSGGGACVARGASAGVGTASCVGSGHTLATAGDFNGDGYADVLAFATSGVVYSGSLSGLGSSASPTVGAMTAARAGDTNGDGYADALALDINAENDGNVRSFEGGSSGLTPPADHSTGVNDFRAFAAGDTNGDGYTDLHYSVEIDIFSGGSLKRATVRTGHTGGLGGGTSTDFHDVTSNSGNDSLGSLSAGSDFNGDGYEDVVMTFGSVNLSLRIRGGAGSGPGGNVYSITTGLTGLPRLLE